MDLASIIDLISKSPVSRTDNEISDVVSWLQRKVTLFKDLQPDLAKHVVKHCKVLVMEKDQVTVRQGDKGERFYVILKGRVSVFVGEGKSPDLQDNIYVDRKDSTKSKSQKMEGASVEGEFNRAGFGNKVAVFSDGRSFGELALQNSESVRAATVITDTRTTFLTVDKDLYNRSIKEIQSAELSKLRQFVEQHPYFEQWPQRLQLNVANCMTKVNLGDREELVKQGAPLQNLWFLVSGEVKIILDNRTLNNQVLSASGHERMRHLTVDHVQVRRIGGYQAAEQYQQSRHEELCVLRSPDVIGDSEQILGLQHYSHSADTVGDVVLYQISVDNIKRLLSSLQNKYGVHLYNEVSGTWVQTALANWQLRSQNVLSPSLSKMVAELQLKLDMSFKARGFTKAVRLTSKQKSFEALVVAYLDSRAPLIEPCTPDAHVFKLSIQRKATLRKLQSDFSGHGQLKPITRPKIKPLQNNRKARSVVRLRHDMKRLATTDAGKVVAPSNSPVTLPEYGIKNSESSNQPEEVHVASVPIFDSVHEKTVSQLPLCADNLDLVQGKTLKFFSQYLKGRMEDMYGKTEVNNDVVKANDEAAALEDRLNAFLEENDAESRTAIIQPLRRLSQINDTSILPGGKCTIYRSPCKLTRRQFKVKNHNHTTRHII